mgnify:CR=1 FL=1
MPTALPRHPSRPGFPWPLWLLLTLLLVSRAAVGVTLKADDNPGWEGQESRFTIERGGSEGNCGLEIDYGDGQVQRLGLDEGLNHVQVSHRYQKAGDYRISVVGRTQIRGFGIAVACSGDEQSLTHAVREKGNATAVAGGAPATRGATGNVEAAPRRAASNLARAVDGGRRLALVIGNDNYSKYSEVRDLKNARNDAKAMARELTAAGFKVTLLEDTKRDTLFNAVDGFTQGVRKNDEVVFYFSGHGVQMGPAAYLLPTDIRAESEKQVARNGLQLDEIATELSKARYALLVIDACRDNPFPRTGTKSIGQDRGLQPFEPPEGVDILMAAGPGQKALDRLSEQDPDPNGLFTREFLRQMKTPGLPVKELLERVREEVEAKAATINHRQRPSLRDDSSGSFYFYASQAPEPVPSATTPYTPAAEPQRPYARPVVDDPETALWKAVERGNSAVDYEAYLKEYPKGKYLALARERLKRLQDEAAQAGVRQENDLWQQAERRPGIESYNAYLSAYPRGRYATLAATRVRQLESEQVETQEKHAWSLAENGDRAAVESYLGRYPNGRYAAPARLRLAQLKKEESAVKPGTVFKDCSECPEMVAIPAGSFEMGSPASEEGRFDDEGPVHGVRIGQAFALGKTEVTVADFRAFVRSTAYRSDAEKNAGEKPGCYAWDTSDGKWDWRSGRYWDDPGFSQSDKHPVVCVSWNDARAYVAWLKQKTGQEYRLPSEAEWEYAARGGTRTARYWGDNPNDACRYANVADKTAGPNGHKWTTKHDCSDGYFFTAPVGSFEANKFKLHDMIGNAWEWVEDCWHNSYTGAPSDGRAWTESTCVGRVLRGGSFFNSPQFARAAFRYRSPSDRDYYGIGFRLARTLP